MGDVLRELIHRWTCVTASVAQGLAQTARWSNAICTTECGMDAEPKLPTSDGDLLGFIETVIPRRRRVAGLGGVAV